MGKRSSSQHPHHRACAGGLRASCAQPALSKQGISYPSEVKSEIPMEEKVEKDL